MVLCAKRKVSWEDGLDIVASRIWICRSPALGNFCQHDKKTQAIRRFEQFNEHDRHPKIYEIESNFAYLLDKNNDAASMELPDEDDMHENYHASKRTPSGLQMRYM